MRKFQDIVRQLIAKKIRCLLSEKKIAAMELRRILGINGKHYRWLLKGERGLPLGKMALLSCVFKIDMSYWFSDCPCNETNFRDMNAPSFCVECDFEEKVVLLSSPPA